MRWVSWLKSAAVRTGRRSTGATPIACATLSRRCWKGATDCSSCCISASGWHADHFRVVVIEPELEAWIWQRNQRGAAPLGFATVDQLVASVRESGLAWPDGQPKPTRPKEVLEAVCRARGIGFSAALHRSITASVSLVGCQDPAFVHLRTTLRLLAKGCIDIAGAVQHAHDINAVRDRRVEDDVPPERKAA